MPFVKINELIPYDNEPILFGRLEGEQWAEYLNDVKACRRLEPVVISQDKHVIDGYDKLRAYKEFGFEEIYVEVVHYACEEHAYCDYVAKNAKAGRFRRGNAAEQLIRTDMCLEELDRCTKILDEKAKQFHENIEALKMKNNSDETIGDVDMDRNTNVVVNESISNFDFNGKNIRVVAVDNEPWWVLTDVCKVLEISHVKDTADRLDRDEVGQTEVIDRLGRKQIATIINESGLYSVILRSDKPQAKPFRKWVTSEVLPTIRKTGSYSINQKQDSYMIDDPIDRAKRWIEEREQYMALEQKIEMDKPKVVFAESVGETKDLILVRELAKLIKQNGIDTGEKRLYSWLRENGYLIKRRGTDYNMPTQRSLNLGLFRIVESSYINSNGDVRLNKTPKITAEGQKYFINLFKNKVAEMH